MKLLFDENLSPKLVIFLADLFPGSIYMRDVGLKSAKDETIWDYAFEHLYTIVSKDADMHQKSILFGFPPKVIWLRLGNLTISDAENVLRKHISEIKAFFEDAYSSFLVLS